MCIYIYMQPPARRPRQHSLGSAAGGVAVYKPLFKR